MFSARFVSFTKKMAVTRIRIVFLNINSNNRHFTLYNTNEIYLYRIKRWYLSCVLSYCF